MKAKKTYAVLGLGRYGTSVARELVENGMEVIAIDTDQKIINDAAAFLPVCKCADVTDAEVISRLGIGNIDTVIVCMASNLESSVMAITLCKEAGVKTVIAKCANEMHQKIMLRVGADQVVFPENGYPSCEKFAQLRIYRYDLSVKGCVDGGDRREGRVDRKKSYRA